MDDYWLDFETRPIGGSNPYHCCVGCGISVPSINGDIDAHGHGCTEVTKYYDKIHASITLTSEDGWVHVSYDPWFGKNLLDTLGYLTGVPFYITCEDAEALSSLAREVGCPLFWDAEYAPIV